MPNVLITTDLHLTDSIIEAYRWDIFNFISKTVQEYPKKIDIIAFLGDMFDRKDRHTGILVNRVINQLLRLIETTGCEVIILAGNHDKPLNGPYYWEFMNHHTIKYITQPQLYKEIYLLPFSSDPTNDWKSIDWTKGKVVFMHQTGEGAVAENDFLLTSHKLPKLPNLPIYSGDVHRPQTTANGIVYVGVPHPVRFSESWDNRIFVLNTDDASRPFEIKVPSIKRDILDIHAFEELSNLRYKQDDQIRIRYHLQSKNLSDWPVEQEKIKKWASDKGIFLASVEASIIGDGLKKQDTKQLETIKPEEVVRMFCEQEKLDPQTLEMGISLIQESVSSN